MDQSAEEVTATQLPEGGRRTRCLTTCRRHGCDQAKASVRSAPVVVLDVDVEHASLLPGADDQQLVQALPADRADPRSATALALAPEPACR